jgi:hypothetical protein
LPNPRPLWHRSPTLRLRILLCAIANLLVAAEMTLRGHGLVFVLQGRTFFFFSPRLRCLTLQRSLFLSSAEQSASWPVPLPSLHPGHDLVSHQLQAKDHLLPFTPAPVANHFADSRRWRGRVTQAQVLRGPDNSVSEATLHPVQVGCQQNELGFGSWEGPHAAALEMWP